MKKASWKFEDWTCITSKRWRQEKVHIGEWQGTVGIMAIDEVTEPQFWHYGGGDMLVCDRGMRWLTILPENEYYCIWAGIDQAGEIVFWYIDMIADSWLDSEGTVCYDDLYLDLIVYPDGRIFVDDMDELEAALEQQDISQELFDLALETSDKLQKGLLSDLKGFCKFTKKCLSACESSSYAVPMLTLQEKIATLPALPGCYLFTNKENRIIYIGKSKSLKNRVRQYFQRVEEKEGKYKRLTREIADVTIIRTETERDALILECKLIKQHQPRYNSQLKRKKHYPYIRIDTKVPYSPISIAAEYRPDQGSYYGFFYSEDEAYDTIRLLNSIWRTPICGKTKFAASHQPCFNYHLKKCCAPCAGMVTEQEYAQKIKEIRKCLEGKSDHLLQQLQKNMKQAVKAMDFENAANCRDIILQLEKLRNKSKRLNTFFENQEVFLLFRAFYEQDFSCFYILDGRVRARGDFHVDDTGEITPISPEEFLHSIIEKKSYLDTEAEERFLTECLVAIYADKYFIAIPRKANQAAMVRCLTEGIAEFVQTSMGAET